MTPEEILAHVEEAFREGYQTAVDSLREMAKVAGNKTAAKYLAAGAELLQQVKPKGPQ